MAIQRQVYDRAGVPHWQLTPQATRQPTGPETARRAGGGGRPADGAGGGSVPPAAHAEVAGADIIYLGHQARVAAPFLLMSWSLTRPHDLGRQSPATTRALTSTRMGSLQGALCKQASLREDLSRWGHAGIQPAGTCRASTTW